MIHETGELILSQHIKTQTRSNVRAHLDLFEFEKTEKPKSSWEEHMHVHEHPIIYHPSHSSEGFTMKYKKSAQMVKPFLTYCNLKNLAIWLVDTVLNRNWRTGCDPIMRFSPKWALYKSLIWQKKIEMKLWSEFGPNPSWYIWIWQNRKTKKFMGKTHACTWTSDYLSSIPFFGWFYNEIQSENPIRFRFVLFVPEIFAFEKLSRRARDLPRPWLGPKYLTNQIFSRHAVFTMS